MVEEAFVNRYSRLDRALHRLSFLSGGLQVALADMEDSIYRELLRGVAAERPIFIAGLPRAGTTILLNLLFATGEFATHTYRRMPFPLCPLLWQRLSAPFHQEGAVMERAHGDGLLVSADSPEAFEETVWLRFWRGHYESDRIAPWSDDPNAEFDEFMANHMRKIIALADEAGGLRYLSKNNQNIARLGYLLRAFPDAAIVVPFRSPLQHAASLLKQHLSFSAKHKEDRFARDYMRAIGHFDFGENLRPIDFDGWLDRSSDRDSGRLSFWLAYWIATHRHVLEQHSQRVCLVAFETLRAEPQRKLRRIADAIGLNDPSSLVARHSEIRAAKPHDIGALGVDPALLAEAHEIYLSLMTVERDQDSS